MTNAGLNVITNRSFEVKFLNRKVGVFIPDLIVNDVVVVELKCCEYLLPEHQAQLINFRRRKLEYKRSYRAYPATCDLDDPVPF